MALQLNYTNALGNEYPECYARIHEFYGNGTNIYFEIAFYENVAAYNAGNHMIDRFNYQFPYVDGMTLTDAYTTIKNQTLFVNAVDV